MTEFNGTLELQLLLSTNISQGIRVNLPYPCPSALFVGNHVQLTAIQGDHRIIGQDAFIKATLQVAPTKQITIGCTNF